MTPAQIAHIMALVDRYAHHYHEYRTSRKISISREFEEARAAVEAALRDAPQAEGWVMVPKAFMSGFHTLAHNWSLEAIPPDYMWGTEADVFKSTYRQCGHELAKLKNLLATPPSAVEAAQPDWRDAARKSGFRVERGFGLLPTVPEDVFAAGVCITKELEAFTSLLAARSTKGST